MYEDRTFEELISQALSYVSEGIDKRQGSIIYDTLAPVCIELARLYSDLELAFDNCFADTASREYLIRRCAERGIEPYPAEKALVKGVFNIDVDIGSRFNLDKFNYRVKEKTGKKEYILECETYGTQPNTVTGRITPLEYIPGFTQGSITEILVPGRDEEDIEDFRRRYFETVKKTPFGGNIYDYCEKVKDINGVGQVRVYRCPDGPGTVGISITDTQGGVPSESLINTVQKAICPKDPGDGSGIAPIGHIVTVSAVKKTDINIKVSLRSENGQSEQELKERVTAISLDYFKERNRLWEDGDFYIYASQLIARLLDTEGITDVESVTLNNASALLITNSVAEVGNVEVTVIYA